MKNAFQNSTQTLINHRGYKVRFVENTFEAFSEAVDKGFCFLETDLRATADGHIVLTHDHNLFRLGGSRKCIESFTRKELEEFRHVNGQKLMFLDTLFEAFRSQNWVFDIKPQTSSLVTESLIAMASKDSHLSTWINEHVKFLCWVRCDEQRLHETFPNVPFFADKPECIRVGLCYLLHLMPFAVIKGNRTYSVTETFKGMPLFTKRYVQGLHIRSARALAFLPNSKAAWDRAIHCGFDEFLLDIPVRDLPG